MTNLSDDNREVDSDVYVEELSVQNRTYDPVVT